MTTDAFNRANEAPLASPWASAYGGGCNLTSNVATSTSATDRGSHHTGSTADESSGTVGALINNSQYAGVLVRADASGNAFQLATDGATGTGHTFFGRWTAGSFAELGGIATTFAAGDKIRLTASGISGSITLTAYKDSGGGWTQVGQITGQTGNNSGAPGVGCYGVATIDDWSDGAGGGGGGGGGNSENLTTRLVVGDIDRTYRPRPFGPGRAR